MENTDLLLLLLLCGGILLLIIAGIVKYLMDHLADVRYVKMEISRAGDWNEFVYWQRELSALRWSILPGLTPDRVKRIKKRFYRGKYAKKREKSDGFASLLMPSILGICICAICLAGSTFAWFTASQSTQTQSIQAASYTVATEISAEDGTLIATGNSVTLQEGTYTVKLTATGDAKTGYTTIKIGDADKLIFQFPSVNYSERTVTFTLVMNEPAKVEFASCWGTSIVDDTNRILQEQAGKHTYGKAEKTPPAEEKDETTEPPADTTEDTTTEETTTTETEPTLDPTQYTVQSGDSLSKIADLYGESVKRLQVYNNIENPSQIYAGQVIKIPPAGWEIPETTTTEETTPPATIEPEATETEPSNTEPSGTTTENTEATATTTVESQPTETEG